MFTRTTFRSRLQALFVLSLLAGCGADGVIWTVDPGDNDDTPAQAVPDLPPDAPEVIETPTDPVEPPPVVTPDPTPDPEPEPPSPDPTAPPPALHVYSNNIENLEEPTDGCPGDWKDLFFYIKSRTTPLDVFMVQQVANKAQLTFLVQYMNDHLPGTYAGIIAQADPDPMLSPCGKQKGTQTNAIIYRKGRLTPTGSKYVWQSWASIDNTCKRSRQARTYSVMQKFIDKQAGDRTVSVASIHWSTNQGTSGDDRACAKANVKETDAKLHLPAFTADLYVWGGDTNETERDSAGDYKPWYALANAQLDGNLKYRDVIFALCKAQTAKTVKACLNDNATTAHRIDFMFGQRGNGAQPSTTGMETISFAEAGAAATQISGGDEPQSYSDHRAVRSFIHY
jgi:hypothetical protein